MNKDSSQTAQTSFNEEAARFATFLNNTDQKAVELQAIVDGLQTFAPDVWDRAIDPQRHFDTFFMGVGTGGIEIPLLQKLLEARGNDDIDVFCEDPSEKMRKNFIDKWAASGLGDLVVDYDLTPFDADYTPPAVDLALASHVWYYVPDWQNQPTDQNTLATFAQAVEQKEGAGLIIVHSNTSDRYVLRSLFLALTTEDEDELSGEDLAQALGELHIPYKTQMIEAHTSIQSCFENGKFNPNEEGRLLLSFLLRTGWGTLDADLQDILSYSLANTVNKNGKPEMKFNDLGIWVGPAVE